MAVIDRSGGREQPNEPSALNVRWERVWPGGRRRVEEAEELPPAVPRRPGVAFGSRRGGGSAAFFADIERPASAAGNLTCPRRILYSP